MTSIQTRAATVAMLAFVLSASTVCGQILLPNGQPDPNFNTDAMQVWLRADSGIGIPDADGLVDAWADRSNHGNNAATINGDPVLRPTHVPGSPTVRAAVEYIDNGERLQLPGAVNGAFQGGFTVFTVVQPNDGDPNRDELWFGVLDPAAGTPSRFVQGTDGNNNPHGVNTLYKAGGTNANANIAPSPIADGPSSGYTVLSYVNEANGTSAIYVNGDSAAASVGASIDNSNFTDLTGGNGPCVGSACSGISAWPNSGTTFNGKFAELIIYEGALSTSDRKAVEDYLLTFSSNPPVPNTEFEWITNELGSWGDANNWNPSQDGPPNQPNHSAVFGSTPTVPTLVAVSDSFTVNRLEFNHTESYVIGGHGSVNLTAKTDMAGTLPTLEVVQGSHQFQAIVNLSAETTASVASDSELSFNNELNLAGNTLNKTGHGTLYINNRLTAGGGTVNALQGIVAGDGTIGGDLNNEGGIISPGGSEAIVGLTEVVPEPSALPLLLLGVIALLLSKKR